MFIAGPVLAESSPTGMNYWLWLAPVVVAAVIVTWIALTRHASRKRIHRGEPDPGAARGPVHGGVVEGDPGQRKAGRPGSTDRG
ncbi:hypothetical protein [Actinomadura kijaniata]|uniref:hypothetical protein n=1 Tax=Actinomadura kijaniata TaxID=46161 RepID=UPI00082E4C9E|nr:hypothetical protein [Actinomadura kijaniata]